VTGMGKVKIKPTLTKGVAKVPVIMQLEALECGAASLCMLMAYYEKWIPLEQVRSDCGVSRDGSNAKNIYKAAQSYGFDVKAYRKSPENLRDNGQFPCIIHWNMNHFVVLDGFRGKWVYLNDPARRKKGKHNLLCQKTVGRRRGSDCFRHAHNGNCISFRYRQFCHITYFHGQAAGGYK